MLFSTKNEVKIDRGGINLDYKLLRELAEINGALPKKLALLSQRDPDSALKILRDWGRRKKTLRALWKEVNEELEKVQGNNSHVKTNQQPNPS